LVMSGLVHIRIPNSTLPQAQSEAWVQGGKYGFIIAVDTLNVSKTGHVTDFPGADETVIAQFPMEGGIIPDHEVLYSGPCGLNEMIGI